jgi:hypothetical protein
MTIQGWIVLGAVVAAGLFFGRKALRNLGKKGEDAGCGCCGGGSCGKQVKPR